MYRFYYYFFKSSFGLTTFEHLQCFCYDINFICKNSVNCLQMTCNRKFEVSPNYLPELSLTGYHIVSVFIKIKNRFGRLLRDLHT